MRTLLRTIAALCMVMAAACGDGGGGTVGKDAHTTVDSGIVDGGVVDTPTPTDDASCFTNPTTHNELINACTDAQPIAKDPTLPLLLDDGGLPPLP
jgi:hypothetical protein